MPWRLRVVTLGEVEGGQIRVLSGLNAGERVAIDKQPDLYDGALVSTMADR
jgi:hypothetical protein